MVPKPGSPKGEGTGNLSLVGGSGNFGNFTGTGNFNGRAPTYIDNFTHWPAWLMGVPPVPALDEVRPHSGVHHNPTGLFVFGMVSGDECRVGLDDPQGDKLTDELATPMALFFLRQVGVDHPRCLAAFDEE